MFVLPIYSACALVCVTISFAYELTRILVAYYLMKPSDKLRLLKIQKAEMAVEILSISVNQELVKHSLLTRKIIKTDKDIETIQSEYAPKATKVKNFFRICRVILYVVCGVYLSHTSIVMVNPEIFWPFSWFTRNDLIYFSPISTIFISGLAVRHTLRTVLPIVFRNVVFP